MGLDKVQSIPKYKGIKKGNEILYVRKEHNPCGWTIEGREG